MHPIDKLLILARKARIVKCVKPAQNRIIKNLCSGVPTLVQANAILREKLAQALVIAYGWRDLTITDIEDFESIVPSEEVNDMAKAMGLAEGIPDTDKPRVATADDVFRTIKPAFVNKAGNIEPIPTRIANMTPTTLKNFHDLEQAAKAFLADVRARHPGEELYCPHVRSIDAALEAIERSETSKPE